MYHDVATTCGFKVGARTLGEHSVAIHLDGEFDVYTAPEIRQILCRFLDEGVTELLINLEHVRYIDSTGLSALLTAARRLGEGRGRIVLVSTHPQINKIFQITGLNKVFRITRTEAEAERVLAGTPQKARV